eukprot:1942631-Pyramimonas_sp.AAC.1
MKHPNLYEAPECVETGLATAYAAELTQARDRCGLGAAPELAGRFTWAFSLAWGKAGGVLILAIYDQAHGSTLRADRRIR